MIIRYSLVLIIGVSLGVLIEILQSLVQREASLSDMARNLFGILAGLFLIIYFNLSGQRSQHYSNSLYIFIAALFFLLGVAPLLQLSWHYIERHNAFPVLIEFGEDWPSSFVRFTDAEMLKEENLSVNEADNLQLIQFNQGEHPGFFIFEPEPDWTQYSRLRVSVFSWYEHDHKLNIRVHDSKHNQEHLDRFNYVMLIRPGINMFSIALNQVKHGPASRELDMSHVAGVILFSVRLEEPLQFALSNIYLD